MRNNCYYFSPSSGAVTDRCVGRLEMGLQDTPVKLTKEGQLSAGAFSLVREAGQEEVMWFAEEAQDGP